MYSLITLHSSGQLTQHLLRVVEDGRIERVDLLGAFLAAFGDQIAGKKLAEMARGCGFV